MNRKEEIGQIYRQGSYLYDQSLERHLLRGETGLQERMDVFRTWEEIF